MNDARQQELYGKALADRTSNGREACVAPEALQALVERDGSEEERLITLDHVMSCEGCRHEFELLRSVDAARETMEEEGVSLPIEMHARRPMPALALAASLAIVVIGGIVGTMLLRTGGPEVFRGTGPDVVLVAPMGEVDQTDPVTLVWRRVEGAAGYEVELLNENGQPVATHSTGDTLWIVDPVRLEPGREYQWWVRTRSGNWF
jgi:hypothetical protein